MTVICLFGDNSLELFWWFGDYFVPLSAEDVGNDTRT